MVDPTEVERRLIESAQFGVLLNLSAERASDVRAVVIRDLLRGIYAQEPDPRGVRLRGARIIGELDSPMCALRSPLTGGSGRRLLHLASGAFIGHGHRPFRALGCLAGVCLLAGITSLAAFALGITIPATPPCGVCSPAEAFGLAADTDLPVLKTGAAKRCEFATTRSVGQAFFATSYVLQMLGWAFATLFVAGYTGLVRKIT